jgi:hypothetical protein
MIHKGCRYNVEQDRGRHAWRWTVFLDAHQPRTGLALTRADAILDAEFVIEAAERAGELL